MSQVSSNRGRATQSKLVAVPSYTLDALFIVIQNFVTTNNLLLLNMAAAKDSCTVVVAVPVL